MPKHYFRKEQPNNPVRDSKGEKIPFIPISSSLAFIELDDANPTHKQWVAELDAVIVSRKLGVSRLDAAQYADMAQKKTPLTKLPHWLGGKGGDGRDEISDLSAQKAMAAAALESRQGSAARAAVVATKAEPAVTPATPLHIDPRPPVGRLKPASVAPTT